MEFVIIVMMRIYGNHTFMEVRSIQIANGRGVVGLGVEIVGMGVTHCMMVPRENEHIGMKPISKLKVNLKTGTKNTLTRKRQRKKHRNPTPT